MWVAYRKTHRRLASAGLDRTTDVALTVSTPACKDKFFDNDIQKAYLFTDMGYISGR
jgi:hypothetical protein